MSYPAAPLSPSEVARADYRRHVIAELSRAGELLPDAAALVVDAFASAPRDILAAPTTPHARHFFDVCAEDHGIPPLLLAELHAVLALLEARGLLPVWCTLPDGIAAVDAGEVTR